MGKHKEGKCQYCGVQESVKTPSCIIRDKEEEEILLIMVKGNLHFDTLLLHYTQDHMHNRTLYNVQHKENSTLDVSELLLNISNHL